MFELIVLLWNKHKALQRNFFFKKFHLSFNLLFLKRVENRRKTQKFHIVVLVVNDTNIK